MTSAEDQDLEINIDELFEDESTEKVADQFRQVANSTPTGNGDHMEKPDDQPWRIDGGLHGIGDDLENRVRNWRDMVRLLKQQRPQLETAAAERDKFLEALDRVVPDVRESSGTLKAALEKTQSGDISDNLAAHFNRNMKALEDLEGVAEALTGNLVWMRSVWEQYARTIVQAQAMRDEMEQGGSRR